MKAFYRETRLKHANNPTGEVFKLLIPYLIRKIAVRLRAFRAAAWPILILSALSCTAEQFDETCITGDCEAFMVFPVKADKNGYYHVKLDWTREYLPYFIIDVEATPIHNNYRYNNVSVVEAQFDSNTTWVIGDTISFTEPTYRPFTGDYTQSGTPLPTGGVDINLPQFKGTKVNIVQPSPIYFRESGGMLYSKRVVGPIPPTLINDTITLYMEVFWDAGGRSILKSHYSQKFIVE